MFFSTASVFLLALSPLALARPTKVQSTESFLKLNAALEKRDDTASGSWPFSGNCDLSLAAMPSAPTPLPSPAEGETLKSVMLGRGTQNYTCDTTKPESEPVAIGALASLFNASCIAATFPSLLEMMPGIAVNFPVPDDSPSDDTPADVLLAGHHYFLDDSTPFFNLDTSEHEYGTVAVNGTSKLESDPPSTATLGADNQGHGAVAWLRLESVPGNFQYKTVYRVNTAGGSPPSTCEGMESTFEVDYAAEYWFYE